MIQQWKSWSASARCNDTGIIGKSGLPAEAAADVKASLKAKILQGRLGSSDEIARVVLSRIS